MNKLKEEGLEVLYAVLPIIIVVIVLQFTLIHLPWPQFIQFLIGSLMTMAGLALFLYGVKIGLLPLGESIGSYLPQRGSFALILFFGFLLGFVVTIAEPDVRILASQVDGVSEGLIPKNILIYSVALGVGIFVALAMIRTLFSVELVYILMPSYLLAFILSYFIRDDFVAIAFDSGGVTTGPVTVPFILALNIGVVSVLRGKNNISDGFGLVALASIGPILSVLILGVIYQ